MSSTASPNTSALLTVADIIRLKNEYEADVRLLEDLPARIKLKKRKYEAALLFAPDGFDPDAPAEPPAKVFEWPESQQFRPLAGAAPSQPPTPPTPPAQVVDDDAASGDGDEVRGPSWVKAIRAYLLEAKSGVAHKALLDALLAQGMLDSVGHKGFYNAIARLEKRGQLVKAGGLLYADEVHDEMMARGEQVPTAPPRQGGSSVAILSVLRGHPEGIDGPTLRELVKGRPEAPASLSKHTHYIYNALATLIGQGLVEKDDRGNYRAKEMV